jgi:hypothetical protein
MTKKTVRHRAFGVGNYCPVEDILVKYDEAVQAGFSKLTLEVEVGYEGDVEGIDFYGDRLETDKEYNDRLKREEKERERAKKAKEKRLADERARYERVKKDYERLKKKFEGT